MPTECPAQIVTAVVTTNSARALQLKVSGPNTMATTVIAPTQIDLAGIQTTLPSRASLSCREIILPVDMVFIGNPSSHEHFPNHSLAFWRLAPYLGNKLIIYYLGLGI